MQLFPLCATLWAAQTGVMLAQLAMLLDCSWFPRGSYREDPEARLEARSRLLLAAASAQVLSRAHLT